MKQYKTLTAVCTFSLLMTACGGDTSEEDKRLRAMEEAARDQGIHLEASVDASTGKETIEVKQGAARIGQNLKLPENFPGDVVVSPDWNVIAASPVPPAGFSVQAMTQDNADSVIAMLRKEMASHGWREIEPQGPTGPLQRVGFEKDDRMAAFTLIANGSTNMIQLATMPKP